MTNKFRATNGARYLKGLFFETTNSDKSTVVYTLKDEDHEGFPSLYRLYMEMEDPYEARFARTHLDGWEHWKMLCECTWFQPVVARWREELELMIRGRALVNVQTIAESESKSALAANKILLEGGWKDKAATNGRGRPKKPTDVKQEKVIAFATRQRLQEDAERILAS